MPEIFTILLGVAALAALVVFAWLLARSFRKPSPIKIALTAATARTPAPAEPDLPRVLLDPEEDDDFDPTKVNFALGSNAAGAPVKLLHDQDADEDIPTQPHALFVVRGDGSLRPRASSKAKRGQRPLARKAWSVRGGGWDGRLQRWGGGEPARGELARRDLLFGASSGPRGAPISHAGPRSSRRRSRARTASSTQRRAAKAP